MRVPRLLVHVGFTIPCLLTVGQEPLGFFIVLRNGHFLLVHVSHLIVDSLVLGVIDLVQNLLLNNSVLVSSQFTAHTVLFVSQAGTTIRRIVFTTLLNLFALLALPDLHLSF